jgi:hypothetical protein
VKSSVIEDGEHLYHGRQIGSLALVAATGRGASSALIKLDAKIAPRTGLNFGVANVDRIWAVHSERAILPGEASLVGEDGSNLSNVIISSVNNRRGEGESHIYSFASGALVELEETDFDSSAGATLEVGTFAGGTHVIQVLETEVRVFDGGKSLFCYILYICFPHLRSTGMQKGVGIGGQKPNVRRFGRTIHGAGILITAVVFPWFQAHMVICCFSC